MLLTNVIPKRNSHKNLQYLRGFNEEVVKMAEFGRVCAGLIHEISTPLTAANLTLAQLGDRYNSNDLIKQIRRELYLLERYILAARLQLKGKSTPTSFSPTIAIHQVGMLLYPKAKQSGVKLLISTSGAMRIYGDRVKFIQIITNLVNNAIEAYEGISKRPRFVEIRVRYKGNNLAVISVSDKGVGISLRNLKRVFDPLFSTKESLDRGMGIGLSTVKSYIEQDFGGTIKVHSLQGAGTNFTVVIPIKRS
jgi:signal transduction histidine kinase